MDSRLALLHLVRRMGGVEAVAPLLAGGKRPDTLRKELTGVPGYKLGLDDAEQDGQITANELAQAEREFSELVSAGQAYLTRLTAMHQAGKQGL